MSRRPRPQGMFLAPRVVRPAPDLPVHLGDAGSQAWAYIWSHAWVNPSRHQLIVTRYCRIQDLLDQAFAAVARDGFMATGSHQQLRSHPAMSEIRLLSTESRLIETELGLTPSSESKAGAPPDVPRSPLEDEIARRNDERERRVAHYDDDGADDDDPRIALVKPGS